MVHKKRYDQHIQIISAHHRSSCWNIVSHMIMSPFFLHNLPKLWKWKQHSIVVQNHIKVAAEPLQIQNHYKTSSKHNNKLQGTIAHHHPNDLNLRKHVPYNQTTRAHITTNTNPAVAAIRGCMNTTPTLLQQKPHQFHQQVHKCWTQCLRHLSQHSACN